jgi:hypothetical protein
VGFGGTSNYVSDQADVLEENLGFGGIVKYQHNSDSKIAFHQESLVLGEIVSNQERKGFTAKWKEPFNKFKSKINSSHSLNLINKNGKVYQSEMVGRGYMSHMFTVGCCLMIFAKPPKNISGKSFRYAIFQPRETPIEPIRPKTKPLPSKAKSYLENQLSKHVENKFHLKKSQRIGQNSERTRYYVKFIVRTDSSVLDHTSSEIPFIMDYVSGEIEILYKDLKYRSEPHGYSLSAFIDRNGDKLADTWYTEHGGAGPWLDHPSWRPREDRAVITIRNNEVVILDDWSAGV